jgi:CMP-N-acetylneuraminic acid synthetase
MSHSIVAIIPMRHFSERVPGKNYRPFAGKPLYHHIVHSLQASGKINKIVIDTDSPVILEEAAKCFPDVLLLERPAFLREGNVPMNDVLLNITRQVPASFYLQTHSTNPLLSISSIQKAVEEFLRVYPMFDSLFSVTRRQVRYWDLLARPLNHNQHILLRTQDLPPVFEENSCMYLFNQEILERKHNRIGDRPFLFEIPEIESQDIDVELNFKMAEFLYHYINGNH